MQKVTVAFDQVGYFNLECKGGCVGVGGPFKTAVSPDWGDGRGPSKVSMGFGIESTATSS